MDIQKIKELALANGFKLKEQADGSMDLNAYVYDFANAIEQAAKAQAVQEWISVKDQPPPSDPHNREYWVYETLNNKVQHDYWVCPDSDLDQDFEPFFNNWIRNVTHWMPMVKYPKPPVQAQEPTND